MSIGRVIGAPGMIGGVLGVGRGARTVIQDMFAGVNGTTISGRTPDTNSNGNTWVVHSGTWQIQTNRAAKTSINNVNYIYIESGTANVRITATFYVASANNFEAAIALRASASNTLVVQAITDGAGAKVFLYDINFTTYPVLASSSSLSALGVGDHELKVEALGSNIKAWLDGTLALDTTSSQYASATKHGLYVYWASGSTPSGRPFDQILIEAI